MTGKNIDTLINVNDKNLYIEFKNQYKDRPTLVFLHDSLGCVQLWKDFPHQLSETTQCNLLIYDRLGYGRSAPLPTYIRPVNYLEQEADVLNSLLIELNIDKAILFGHSDGGSIALIAASKYPGRIKSIIVEAAHIFVEAVTLKGICNAITIYKNTDLPKRLQKYHGHKTTAIFKAWTATWISPDYKFWNIEYFLKNICCPLLFIQGDADEYGTLLQVEKTIHQVSGEAEKFILPNVGHTPHKDAAEQVLHKSAEFIDRLLSKI